MRTGHNRTEFRAASMASYTKEKLKSILINHNVAIPKDARKEVYLDLYRTHVESMKKSEFSSDDESISRSPTKRNKKKPGLTKKKTEEPAMNGTADISSLTDTELRDKLKSNGINPGPITDSTRRLYEKKLQRLLEAAVHSEASSVKTAPAPKPAPIRRSEPVRYVAPPPPPAEAEFSDPDDEEEEDEPEPEPEPEPRQTALRRRPAAPVRMSPRRPTPVKKYEAPAPRPAPPRQPEPQQANDDEEDDEDVNDGTLHSSIRPYRNGPSVVPASVRPASVATPTPTARTVPAAPPATSGAPRRRLAIWMQVLLFILVAVVIYFVIQNIEPATGKSYIGKLPG